MHREVPAPGRREAAWIKLADLGIKGNSHVMMQEKNTKEIAAVIYQWLDKAVPASAVGRERLGLFPGAAQQLLLPRC